MRPTLALLLFCLCLCWGTLLEADEPGVKVVSKKSGVSALFPNKPTYQDRGQGELYYWLTDEAEGYGMMLQSSPRGKKLNLSDLQEVKDAFESAQKLMTTQFAEAKLVSAKDIEKADKPTREVEFDLGSEGYFFGRWVMFEDKHVQVTVIESTKGRALSAASRKFVESLKLEK